MICAPIVALSLYGLAGGPFWATTNPWNVGAVNYAETITVNPCTFPNGTVIKWSFPSTQNAQNVYSYPEIVYGSNWGTQPASTIPAKPISALTTLQVNYNVSVSAGWNDYDCLIETWPSSTAIPNAQTKLAEVGFLCHTPFASWWQVLTALDKYWYADDAHGFYALIATVQGGSGMPFIIVMPLNWRYGILPRDMIVGDQRMPIITLLKDLVRRGKIPDSYITGFEFGFEVGANSGSATFNNITWYWK